MNPSRKYQLLIGFACVQITGLRLSHHHRRITSPDSLNHPSMGNPRWCFYSALSQQTDRQTDRHLLYPIDLFIAPLIRDYHPTPPIHVVCTTHTLEKSPLKPHFEFIVFPGNPRRSSLLEGRTSMCPINQIHHHGHGRPR